ncbi:acyltransferase [Bacillus sp. UMB0899]|uniref:acyltransferase family protein n=1 Tax=Metabacillus schmidteae TaxID=2730405 RepID=UPI000C80392D|nr:acyltransferase family protein [Metabacillus schmidteae]PMC35267.1 acyltransferase [Bacillus sp. UMB0899]
MNNRLSYFDNAKFFLIFLVVFGHIIRPFIDESNVMLTIYKFVYTFHMPAFILISGYFAKGYNKKGYVSKIAKKLILPYLIFQGIYSVYYFAIEKQGATVLDPLDPHWSLWFLVSLFFWNVFLFGATKLSPKWALLVAFTLGISIGYFDVVSNYLSLSRTFVFFPLFLIGFYLKKEHFAFLTKPNNRVISMLVLAVTFVSYFYLDFDYEWLFGSKPYSQFGEPSIFNAFIRMGFYTLTLITSLSFLALIPKRRAFFTEWGTRTFYVYLLHGFIIQYMRTNEVIEWLGDYRSIALLTLLSILLTSVLSTKTVKEIASPIIELKPSHLYIKPSSLNK